MYFDPIWYISHPENSKYPIRIRIWKHGNPNAEIRSRNPKSGIWNPESGNPDPEILKSRTAKLEIWSLEIRIRKSESGNPNPELRSRNFDTSNPEPGIRIRTSGPRIQKVRNPETWNSEIRLRNSGIRNSKIPKCQKNRREV